MELDTDKDFFAISIYGNKGFAENREGKIQAMDTISLSTLSCRRPVKLSNYKSCLVPITVTR